MGQWMQTPLTLKFQKAQRICSSKNARSKPSSLFSQWKLTLISIEHKGLDDYDQSSNPNSDKKLKYHERTIPKGQCKSLVKHKGTCYLEQAKGLYPLIGTT